MSGSYACCRRPSSDLCRRLVQVGVDVPSLPVPRRKLGHLSQCHVFPPQRLRRPIRNAAPRYSPTCRKAGSRASSARSISCHAPPSRSVHAGHTSRARPRTSPRRELGQVAQAQHSLTTRPALNSPTRGPKSTRPSAPPCLVTTSARAHESAEIDDAVQIAANIRDAEIPGLGQRHRGDVGMPITSPASARRISHWLAAAGQSQTETARPARSSWPPAGSLVPAGTREGRAWRRGPSSGASLAP